MSTDSIVDEDFGEGFEERADQLTDEELRSGTVVEDQFAQVKSALIARGLVLIEGPRGCGKTHMMRYAAIQCREDATRPFAVYVSLNRYLRLEPLLNRRADALGLFQAWALALIARASIRAVEAIAPGRGDELVRSTSLTVAHLDSLIGTLERGIEPERDARPTVLALTIEVVVSLVRRSAAAAGRRRTVLLLDDAALTLTREFLIEFFDLLRVLKTNDISPKASVYPGSTEYGPRFHADHEGRRVAAWLPVEDDRYIPIMKEIAAARFPTALAVPEDVDRVLMYAAFGVPRAYLTMLRDWRAGAGRSGQALLNEVVRSHRDARLAEFQSLAVKMPTLATLIRYGGKLFEQMVGLLKERNDHLAPQHLKQILVAFKVEDFNPMARRMLSLLVEVGLVREEAEVSHGTARRILPLAPHLGALIAARAFEPGRGGGARVISDALALKNDKHPLRPSMSKLLGEDYLAQLHLDEPPCQSCGTRRLSESQRFCHACGKKLLNESTFDRCMRVEVGTVSGLTRWQNEKLTEVGFDTIGTIMAAQNPGSDIRAIRGMGPARTAHVLEAVQGYVDEFLS